MENEVYESKMVADFIKNLQNGTSVLQKPNKEPSYAQNYYSKTVYTGWNMLNVAQGLQDQGKESPFVTSMNQASFNKAGLKNKTETNGEGVKMVGAVAFWHKELKENGVPIKDANGQSVSGNQSTLVFSMNDTVKKIYDKESKKFMSSGDVLPRGITTLPPFVQNPGDVYKAKNESASEILMEKVSEGLRGKYQGNFDGITITPGQIEKIKEEFLAHPKKFVGTINKADAYARSDAKAIAQIESKNSTNQPNQNTVPKKKTNSR